MKTIDTLVEDIYKIVQDKGGWNSLLQVPIKNEKQKARLRLSGLGPKCPRHFWHSINTPELAEPLPPWAEIKYMFGHMVEALAIELAKQAGHEVTGEQDELVVDGVTGHRDCIIDGCVVDVKSTSSFGMAKFKDGSIEKDDPFGYLEQLDGYLIGSREDPLVRVKDKAYILAVDKALGHVFLYEHKLRENIVHNRIAECKAILSQNTPPPCTCESVPDGKSGNMKLGMKASYSPFKYCCFPNLRTFIYSSGPVYLSKVVREPAVMEIDRYGNEITRPS